MHDIQIFIFCILCVSIIGFIAGFTGIGAGIFGNSMLVYWLPYWINTNNIIVIVFANIVLIMWFSYIQISLRILKEKKSLLSIRYYLVPAIIGAIIGLILIPFIPGVLLLIVLNILVIYMLYTLLHKPIKKAVAQRKMNIWEKLRVILYISTSTLMGLSSMIFMLPTLLRQGHDFHKTRDTCIIFFSIPLLTFSLFVRSGILQGLHLSWPYLNNFFLPLIISAVIFNYFTTQIGRKAATAINPAIMHRIVLLVVILSAIQSMSALIRMLS